MSKKESKFGEKQLKPFDTKNDVFNKVMKEFRESVNDFKEKYKRGKDIINMSDDHRDYDDIDETESMNSMNFLIKSFFDDKKDQREFLDQMLGKIFIMIEEFKKSEKKLKKNKDKMRELQESIYRMSSQLDTVESELRELKSTRVRSHFCDISSFDRNSKVAGKGFKVNVGDAFSKKKYNFGDED
jgi:hypothetical protein